MSSNNHLKREAISLRNRGKSYNYIRKTLGIKSKGTLSYWFKDFKLTKKSRRLLKRNNTLASKRGLFLANKRRTIRIKKENFEAYEYGFKHIPSISKNDLLLIGASLYWGEGTKSEKMKSPTLSFSNSDPKMVSVFMKFVRIVLRIPDERIRAGVHIYSSISESSARKFWSLITGLPEDRFYIVTQISRASQGKRPFNTLPYGTAVIKINSRVQFYRIKGMIRGIIDRMKDVA